MHSVICIKQVSNPAQIRVRFLSNTIVQRGVPTNRREAVVAEAPPSSVIIPPARSPCRLWDGIHLSSDCGRRVPWLTKLQCCLSNAPLSMTRSYPRRTHARLRSRRSGRYLVGPLSSPLASRLLTAAWPSSAPGSQRSAARPRRQHRRPRSPRPQFLMRSAEGPVLREECPRCEPRATGERAHQGHVESTVAKPEPDRVVQALDRKEDAKL